jgi:hypothetical protein
VVYEPEDFLFTPHADTVKSGHERYFTNLQVGQGCSQFNSVGLVVVHWLWGLRGCQEQLCTLWYGLYVFEFGRPFTWRHGCIC